MLKYFSSPYRRVITQCHDMRNLGEYEGDLHVDERIVIDLVAACETAAFKLDALPPPHDARA